MNIAVAGTGYVGLSLATLLSQHNHVMAVDIIRECRMVCVNKIFLSLHKLSRSKNKP